VLDFLSFKMFVLFRIWFWLHFWRGFCHTVC